MTDAGDAFVSMGEAARHLGVSNPLLRRRVRETSLVLWQSPRDRRRKLLRLADLEALRVARPIEREEVAVPA